MGLRGFRVYRGLDRNLGKSSRFIGFKGLRFRGFRIFLSLGIGVLSSEFRVV